MKNNHIYIISQNNNKKEELKKNINGLKIEFLGNNAEVILEEPIANFKNSTITLGDNSKFFIKSSHYEVSGIYMLLGYGCICEIGHNFSVAGNTCILANSENNLKIKIGDDCMFATNVILRASDVHKIIDLKNGKRINSGQYIEIGNHCWLAMNTTILKNVKIEDDCVIAAGSIVTKDCLQKHTIIGGVPAKVIKKNVTWER